METLRAGGLTLEPLTAAHADELFALLSSPAIYDFLDHGPPQSIDALRSLYARLEARRSPDGTQTWLNWLVRLDAGGPAGTVQATVLRDGTAWVAYVLAPSHWGRGHAHRAVAAMIEHLRRRHGCHRFLACVEHDNRRSVALLERLGFSIADADEAALHRLAASERLYVG